jgi:uncharacterized 2Fe-2S/4Fe-4S cluster protein (DUF4445 family)
MPNIKINFTANHSAPHETLSSWLETHGHAPEMRCGGRGLCRSCTVQVNGQEIKSCQCKTSTLQPEDEIVLLSSKYRSENLHAVETFWSDPEQEFKLQVRLGYGIAVDIGTTTVVGTLWDLQSGCLIKTASRPNAQRQYGDNVLARISKSLESSEGAEKLQKALVQDTLKPIFTELLSGDGVLTNTEYYEKSILECVIAGNTVMLQSLLGLSLRGLATFPFKAEFLETQRCSASTLNLPWNFPLILLPSCGPFVGADITAGVLSSSFIEHDGPALFIDFGTNGEIVVKDDRARYFATATAAGPAFEGGRLSCGVAANDEAVHHITFQQQQWNLLGQQKNAMDYKGFAGSSYVDYMAEAVRSGWLNEMGRFSEREKLTMAHNSLGYDEARHALSEDLYVSEVDIAELIKAKAAIQAGYNSLLREAGLRADQLKSVVVAGGFGFHLQLSNAIAVGLLPNVPLDRFRVVGNSSLGGASMVLKNPALLKDLELYCQQVRIVELNQLKFFEDEYLDAMVFEL